MKKIYIILLSTTAFFSPTYTMEGLSQSMIGLPQEPFQQQTIQKPSLFDTYYTKQTEDNYKKQKNIIAQKQKNNSKISLDEWKDYQSAIMDYNNNIPKNDPRKPQIQEKLKKLTRNIQQKERRAELAAFVAQSKEDKTIQDLQKYKETLETYLAHLPNPTVEKQKQYQEVIDHINLINEIDEQLQVDYKNFSIDELFEHFERLSSLRTQLHTNNSERYKKLDTTITALLAFYHEKIEERKKQQLIEQRRLNQLEDKLQKEELDQKLDTLIKQAEKDVNEKAIAQRKEMHQKQQKLEQQRLEQEKQRQIDELIKAAKEKQQREALEKERTRQEQEKLAKLEQEKQHLAEQQKIISERQEQQKEQEENAKRWIPWLTNRLNQTGQTVIDFVSNVTSVVTYWLSWLIRR